MAIRGEVAINVSGTSYDVDNDLILTCCAIEIEKILIWCNLEFPPSLRFVGHVGDLVAYYFLPFCHSRNGRNL